MMISTAAPEPRAAKPTARRVRHPVRALTLVVAISAAGCLAVPVPLLGQQEPTVDLTPEERAWLAENTIRVGPAPNFPPVEFFDEDGSYRGIVADYVSVFEQRLGVQFEIIQRPTWSEVVESTEEGEIDVWFEAADTEERREYMVFTEPYLRLPSVIIVRDENDERLTVDDLSGRSVAVGEGYAVVDYLRERVPGIDLVEVPSIAVGLERLAFGGVDAMVAGTAQAGFYSDELGLTTLRVAGESGWEWNLAIGSRKDEPILHDILRKTLDSVGPAERRAIFRSWVSLDDGAGSRGPARPWSVALVAMVSLAFLVWLFLRRGRAVGAVRLEGTGSAWPVYLETAFAIATIATLTWWVENRIADRMRQDVGSTLQTVLNTTSKAVYQWFDERETEARVWGQHADVVELCQLLLSGDSAVVSSARTLLGVQLEHIVVERGYTGFHLAGPSGEMLATSDVRSPAGARFPDAIESLETRVAASSRGGAISLPARSDPSGSDGGGAAHILVGSRVGDDPDSSCMLAFEIDPELGFTEILQRGRIGESGESYAFNADGRLISDSRFVPELRRIGLITADQNSLLEIEIRDPGGNMVTDFRTDVPRSEQPLTRMAASAVDGRSGVDLTGYRDYRGVPVVGAWVWDETVGFGIATEMDMSEAYESLGWVRRMVAGGALLVMFLIVALTGAFRAADNRRRRHEATLQGIVGDLQNANEELESVNSVILRWDSGGRVTFLNDFGLQLFGFSKNEILGKPLLGTIVPEEESTGRSLRRMIDEILENPAEFESNENENMTKAGRRVWMAWRNKPIANEDGALAEILTVGIDITARKKAETALNRQSTALEAAVDGIGITNTDGTLVWINPAFSELTGYSREEAVGQNARILKSNVQDDAFYEHMWLTISEGRVWKGEVVNKRKDGSLYTEEMSITPVRDADGEIVNYVAIKRDITKRKEAELRFRSVTDSANDAIISSDSTSTVVGWNRAAAEMFGWSEEEIIGRPVETIIPERFRVPHKAGMDRYTDTGENQMIGGTTELSGLHREGHEFPIEISLATWNAGENRYYTGIIRDITERKEMEVELEKARHRMEDELNVGREIQMSMLPLIFPPFPRRGEFDVFAALEPAREVGGDFYDFFLIDDDHFCLCVGDVSGKGVPAALFMAVTKTLIKSRALNDYSPASILTHVNNEISSNNDAFMFVTIFLGILDINSGKLLYSNAGHNPPYVRRETGELVRLDQRHGPVIGAVKERVYGQDESVLRPGDLLFLYTDGVTEAMDEEQGLYTEQRLAQLLPSTKSGTTEEAVSAVLADVRDFQGRAEQADDITILAASYFGEPQGAAVRILELDLVNQLDEIERANRAFGDFAETEGVPEPVRRQVNLVLDELLGNVITYAFADDGEHGIDVRIELASDRLSVTITDDGVPFNPFASQPPDTALPVEAREIGGLGIHLVRNVMDEVSYNRRTDANVVILVKYLEDSPGG